MADDLLRILELRKSQQDGTFSPQNQEELDGLLQRSPEYNQLMDIQPEDIKWHLEMSLGEKEEETRKKLWEHIRQLGPRQFTIRELDAGSTPVQRHRSNTKLIAIAIASAAVAAIVLTVVFPVWRYQPQHPKTSSPPLIAKPDKTIFICGKDTIDLDALPEESKLARVGKWLIIKKAQGHIAYQLTKQPQPADHGPDTLLTTLSTPYNAAGLRVTLPDGSKTVLYEGVLKVDLFPNETRIAQRKVQLDGIAMFDISSNLHHPFFVTTPLSTTKVTGTLFLISANRQTNTDSISLYRGNIDVDNGKDKIQLHQGQLATVHQSSPNIDLGDLKETEMKKELPWKQDTFNFSHQDLRVAMERVKKLYDLKSVQFGKDVDTVTPGKLSAGLVSKDLTLNQLLEMVQTSDIHFTTNNDSTIIYVNSK